MNQKYKEHKERALDAQWQAHAIAFAPVVFQVSRLMLKYGIFAMLEQAGRPAGVDSQDGGRNELAEASRGKGMTINEIAAKSGISEYGVKVLLESSLTAGTVFCDEGRFTLSKVGWFLLNDPMVRSDIDFNHDVNYKGMFHLDEAIREGRPAGLKELGDWPTIYEGLSSLAPEVQKSWFGFDHFYSDNSFEQALPHVFANSPRSILDIGGNTGRFAMECVSGNAGVHVTVMDLPQQIAMLSRNIAGKPGEERVHTYAGDILKPDTEIPGGFDAVWMSQFLDCFSETQVFSILERVARTLKAGAQVFIMETLWDRQRFATASFDIAQTSVYFTAMANGNSKMFFSGDLFGIIGEAGLEVAEVIDNLGYGHSLIRCAKR